VTSKRDPLVSNETAWREGIAVSHSADNELPAPSQQIAILGTNTFIRVGAIAVKHSEILNDLISRGYQIHRASLLIVGTPYRTVGPDE
jgi:hypothetical protein